VKLTLFLLLFVCPFLALGKLPPQAKAYLDQVPGQKLSLDFVVQTALMNAEAFQILGYDYATAELEELGQVSPITDTYFTAGGEYVDDNSVKPNPFQPLRNRRWEWNMGLQKNWGTGTNTSVGWAYDTNNLEFELPPGLAGDFLTDYKQSMAVVQLEQSLLKDSFGQGFRERLKAARQRAQSIKWKAREDLESLTLQFINEFYSSWLMQQQVASLRAQVERQQRLVKVLSQRNKKGAVEAPELIQYQALLASTQTRAQQAKTALANQWEKLVVSLKLPSEFLQIDPMDVPTTIDDPLAQSFRLCMNKEPKKTPAIYALEKNLEALDSDFRAAQDDSLPDLKLVAGYRGNSIDTSAARTVSNVLQGEQADGFGRGPAWNVGLQLVWPLSNSAAQAQRVQKHIQKEQTAARLRIAVDELKTGWNDLCRRLKAEAENDRLYRQVVGQQKNRVEAEGRRFSLGRSRVDQLVTAEDDLNNWEYNSQQKSIEVRLLAWQVQKFSGELYQKITPYVEQLFQRDMK
jgi:outer membrane protein TolC